MKIYRTTEENKSEWLDGANIKFFTDIINYSAVSVEKTIPNHNGAYNNVIKDIDLDVWKIRIKSATHHVILAEVEIYGGTGRI